MNERLKQYLIQLFGITNLRDDGPNAWQYDGEITDQAVKNAISSGQLQWLDESQHDLGFGDGSEHFYVSPDLGLATESFAIIRADHTIYHH